MFGFVQIIVIIAALSSNTIANETTQTTSITPRITATIDWRFKTALKVESLKDKEFEKKYDKNETFFLPEVIQYGSEDYQYPLLVDLPDLIKKVKANESLTIKPINDPNFQYLIENKHLCDLKGTNGTNIDLLILVKSAVGNIVARDTIRASWGKHVCWGGRVVRRIFLLGTVDRKEKTIQKQINMEHMVYNDIVQQDFLDNYYNNTYKIMLGLNWATQHCINSRFLMFVDDDYFIHPRIVLSYLESISPAIYSRLISGYVWRTATPQRNPHTKWFVSIQDYPWPMYPPYCSAGNFFLSMDAAVDIAIAMKYTRFLRFDDVFLGIILHKLLMVPIHLTNVFSFNPIGKSSPKYHQMISSHGYKNPKQIFDTWVDLGCAQFCQS